MGVIHATEQNFDTLIESNLVLVDFFATWCGPCKMLSPVLEEMASERSEVEIVKVDIDENINLAKRYGIMSVPTLLLFKNGELVAKQNGFMPKPLLEQFIEENRG